MSLFVDTSVFSLAWRRDVAPGVPEVERLKQALEYGDQVITTGLVLQELLQGFTGAKSAAAIVARFDSIPLIAPTRADHIEAASLRNRCRRAGVQIATIDALLAQLCIGRELLMLSADQDFARIAQTSSLRVWK